LGFEFVGFEFVGFEAPGAESIDLFRVWGSEVGIFEGLVFSG